MEVLATEEYTVEKNSNGSISLNHKSRGYQLVLHSAAQEKNQPYDITFDIPCTGICFTVTGRDLKEYERLDNLLTINSNLQYVEIGAGLAEFIPNMVQRYSMLHRPIIIDPADYTLMKAMMQHAKNLDIGERMHERLETLIKRCDVILDPSKVRLINAFLGQAMHKFDLDGIADVVIDHCGATLYKFTEYAEEDEVREFERRLLKPNGILRIISSPKKDDSLT